MILGWLRKIRSNYVETLVDVPKADHKSCDVAIFREPDTDEGTFGILQDTTGLRCHSLELPDRDNRSNVSRVPAGIYDCVPYKSTKFGQVFLVTNVEHRSYILFHWGNVAGDELKGLKTNSYGCVLLGKYRGKLWGQRAIMASRVAFRAFMVVRGDKPFTLEIKDGLG